MWNCRTCHIGQEINIMSNRNVMKYLSRHPSLILWWGYVTYITITALRETSALGSVRSGASVFEFTSFHSSSWERGADEERKVEFQTWGTTFLYRDHKQKALRSVWLMGCAVSPLSEGNAQFVFARSKPVSLHLFYLLSVFIVCYCSVFFKEFVMCRVSGLQKEWYENNGQYREAKYEEFLLKNVI